MRIAITADPELPVPPVLYGGIERIVDLLARRLVELGHEVTVFAHADSSTAGRLVPWKGHSSGSLTDTLRNAALLAFEVSRSRFEIVHSFSRVAYLAAILPLPVPKLMTYQREISLKTVRWGKALSGGSLHFSAVSRQMTQAAKDAAFWHVVPNGVPLATYSFNLQPPPNAPLIFLGRIEEIKGPHLAIEISQRTGVPLVIAGNIPGAHKGWYETHVAPHVDGRQIRYIGPVNDEQKNELLRQARALLMPILWEEPFGIVMAEALTCGTPVIGLRRGAVPEVIEHGVTGFVCDDVGEMLAAVLRAESLDRSQCRLSAERNFSGDVMTERYLSVYRELTRSNR